MTHLSLFSGVGGLDLAAHWAGFTTVQFVEREPYCQKVLAKNFPGVDIADDVTTFDGLEFRGRVTVLSAGFPCQPHSVAGKRGGSTDKRDLWGEVVRILGESQPRWFVGENVPGLFSSESGRFFGRILDDLAALGYVVGWACYGASDVGAVHRRHRVFIVATNPENLLCDGGNDQPERKVSELGNSHSAGNAFTNPDCIGRNNGCDHRGERHLQAGEGGIVDEDRSDRGDGGSGACENSDACDPGGGGLSVEPRGRAGQITPNGYSRIQGGDWRAWTVKPVIRATDDGLSRWLVRDRVAMLKALGNAVVPQQAFPIFQAIAKECRS